MFFCYTDFMRIDECKNYDDIGVLMLDSLKKLRAENPDTKIIHVCGPWTTGGKGSLEENIKFLEENISQLENQGYTVFKQSSFEDKMFDIKAQRKEQNLFKHYDWDLLHGCYVPIFSSNIFDHLVFLPGYESSIGAQWEYDMALKYGIDIICL